MDNTNIVYYGDRELVRYRRDRVGFVFQFFNLVSTQTAEENLELPMQLSSKPSVFRKKRSRA